MNRNRISFLTFLLLIVMLAFGGCGGSVDDSSESLPPDGITPPNFDKPPSPPNVSGNWLDIANTSWYSESQNNFTISNAEQLAGLAKLVNNGIYFDGKTIVLTNDINLAGRKWTPIATGNTWTTSGIANEHVFRGSFYGNGHTISDMTIIGSFKYTGLFGCIDNYAIIKSVKLKNVYIDLFYDTSRGSMSYYKLNDSVPPAPTLLYFYTGGVVGNNTGLVYDCEFIGYISSYVSGDYSYSSAGGITGFNYGTVSSCDSKGIISSTSYAGGVVGWNYGLGADSDYGTTSGCKFNGNVLSNQYAGGIAGCNYEYGTVTVCESSGKVSSLNNAGGIVGWNGSYCLVSDCESNGSIVGGHFAGGVTGSNNGTVTKCESKGNISSNSSDYCYTGGITGTNSGTVTDCRKIKGAVTIINPGEGKYAGGVIGYLDYNPNSPYSPLISGNTYSRPATGQTWGIGSPAGDNGTEPVI